MTAMKALAHEYRSYGAAGRCAACIAERAELRDLDRTVLDEVERVDYARSAEEIARTITGNAAAETDAALVSLAWLADAEMIERREIHRIVPSGPSYFGYVRLDSMYGHEAPTKTSNEMVRS